jgi:hypothetical protein
VSESRIVARSAELIEAEVDGELVALDVQQGSCFGFNRTATRIWQMLEQPMSLADICARLTQEFDIDPDTCRGQVETLVADMAESGLVKVERPAA